MSETHWKAPSEDVVELTALTVSNGAVLVLENRYLPGLPIPIRWMPYLGPAARTESRLWALEGARRVQVAASRTELYCHATIVMGEPAICSAFDGGTTRFFTVGPAAPLNGRLAALAAVPAWALLEDAGDRGWSFVWRGHGLVAFEPSQREAILLTPSDGERTYQLAVGETVIASVSSRGERSRVRVYSLPKR